MFSDKVAEAKVCVSALTEESALVRQAQPNLLTLKPLMVGELHLPTPERAVTQSVMLALVHPR